MIETRLSTCVLAPARVPPLVIAFNTRTNSVFVDPADEPSLIEFKDEMMHQMPMEYYSERNLTPGRNGEAELSSVVA